MSKQDRQGARTPAELEMRYNFGKSFAEVMGISLDAQTTAEKARKDVQTEIKRLEDSITMRVTAVEEDLSENYSTKKEMSASISLSASEIKSEVTAVEKNLADNYSTTEEMKSEISQSAAEIRSTVTAVEKNLSENYSTTTAMMTQISQKADAIKIEASNVAKSVVDGLEVGGRNLLPKAKFTEDLTEISENSMSGFGFLCPGLQTEISVPGMITGLNLQTDTDYTVSFVAWLDTEDATARQSLTWDLWPDNLPQEFIYADENGLCNIPKKYSWTIRSDQQEMANCNLRFIIFEQDGEGYTAKYPIYITDIKLEKGNKSTDWTPAPEDMATVADMNAAIKVSAEEIQLSVSETYSTKDELSGVTQRVSAAETQITQNANAIALRATKTEVTDAAKAAVDGLNVGGRNLLLKSNVEAKDNVASSHLVAQYAPASCLEEGEEYTISICVTPAPGVTHFNAYLSYSASLLAELPVTGTQKQVISKTFTARYTPERTPTEDPVYGNVRIHRFPNNGTVTESSIIHWAKVEKGNKATDWTPAPEEMATVAELESAISVTAEAIDMKVSKGEIISKINQSAEQISIAASKIKLEGLVTANNNFKVLTDGSIEAADAKISGELKAGECFSVTKLGHLTAKDVTIGDISAGSYLNYGFDEDEGYSTLTVKGHIEATSGTFSGDIKGGSLLIGDTSNTYAQITSNGVLKCRGADISGKVALVTGSSIGGFETDGNSLFSGEWNDAEETTPTVFMCTGSTGQYSLGGATNRSGWVFGAGEHFGVLDTGEVWCSNINATGGKIGFWNIAIDATIPNILGTHQALHTTYMDGNRQRSIYLTPQKVYVSTKYEDGSTGTTSASWVDIINAANA